MPLLVHYAGCTVCHPPEGKLSEEVCSASPAWPFQWTAVQGFALQDLAQYLGAKTTSDKPYWRRAGHQRMQR